MVRASLKFWLAIVLALSLAACQNNQSNVDSEEGSAGENAEETAGGGAGGAGGGDEGSATSTGVGEDGGAIQGEDGESLLTAANFAHHSSQYTGDTGTFVIYFDYDNSAIPVEAYESLKAHAAHIAATGRIELRLEGHTDLRGTPEYNIALGERRAKSIERFLKVHGAQGSKIDVVSYGEEKPVAFGEDELSFAKNRRVELNYKVGRP